MGAPRGLDELEAVRLGGMKGRAAVIERLPGLWNVPSESVSNASGRPLERIRHCGEHSGALPSVGAAAAASASFRRSIDTRCRPTYDTR
jgi:hypothetical protein